MRRRVLAACVVPGVAAVTALAVGPTLKADAASTAGSWPSITEGMARFCAGEKRSEAGNERECILVAGQACEASPETELEANLHREGCAITKELTGTLPARVGSENTTHSSSGGGSGGGLAVAIGSLLVLASMIWVGFDAKKRDWSHKKHGAKTPAGQIIGVVLLWFIFFPVYLVQRRKAPLRLATAPQQGAPATPTPMAGDQSRFKTCPDCAETVLAGARVCKHCGYRFDSGLTASAERS